MKEEDIQKCLQQADEIEAELKDPGKLKEYFIYEPEVIDTEKSYLKPN